jgi:hypothetical protein
MEKGIICGWYRIESEQWEPGSIHSPRTKVLSFLISNLRRTVYSAKSPFLWEKLRNPGSKITCPGTLLRAQQRRREHKDFLRIVTAADMRVEW